MTTEEACGSAEISTSAVKANITKDGVSSIRRPICHVGYQMQVLKQLRVAPSNVGNVWQSHVAALADPCP